MLEHRDKTTLAILNKVKSEASAFKMKEAYDPKKALEFKDAGNALVKEGKCLDAAAKFTEGINHLPKDMMDEASTQIYVALHNNRSLALFKAA